MKCMIKKEKRYHTRGRKQALGEKTSGEGEEVEREVFRKEKRVFLLREMRKKNCAETIYRKTKLVGSRVIENLSSTNS